MRSHTLLHLPLAAALLALACSSGSSGGGDDAGVAPLGASASALLSAVDGKDPWGSLGELTGSFTLQATALASECEFGPDFPFDSNPWDAFQPFSRSVGGTLEQRGDELVLEVGEGLVFARIEADRLVDVVRVGAEGVTRYVDGFTFTRVGTGFVASGESAWSFEGDYWSDESCGGRVSWTLEGSGNRPVGGARDLQFVLRWPVNSGADLDLMVASPTLTSASGWIGNAPELRAFLGEVKLGCHVLHSAGAAGSPDDTSPSAWIQPLRETTLPHHEEVIRCAYGAYGTWSIDVVNWSADAEVPFSLEVFEGPTLGVTRSAERWLGLLEQTIAPHERATLLFEHRPPPLPPGSGSVVITIPTREPAPRPRDPLSHSVLGFNKAALLDVSYGELLENVGLD